MSSQAELEISLAENQGQLDLVRSALAADKSNTELLQLENDLVTLVQLTKDSLLELKRSELLAHVDQIESNSEVI